MNDNSRKNINWINAVKAICIISVYFIHSQLYYGCWMQRVNDFIHPYYVNAFFFVSGYLLFRKQLSDTLIGQRMSEFAKGGGKELFQNVFFKLLIPTILFSLVEYVPKHVLRGESLCLHTLLSNTIGGGTFWFTSALVVAEFVLLFLLFSRRSNIWFYVTTGLIVALIGYYLGRIDFHLFGLGRDPWAYRRGFMSVGFLVMGGLYWHYEQILSKVLNIYMVLALLLVYVIIFSDRTHTAKVLISTMDINWMGYLASLLGCMLLIQLCKLLKPISFLTFVGQNSLCFYFHSGALPMLVSMAVKRFVGSDHMLGLFWVFILSISVAYVVTLLLNRYLPFVFDLRKIRRKTE